MSDDTQITNPRLMGEASSGLQTFANQIENIQLDTTTVFRGALPGLSGANKDRIQEMETRFQQILIEADNILAKFGVDVGAHGDNVQELDRKLSQSK